MQQELPIVQVGPIADYLLGMLREYKLRFKNSLLDVDVTYEDACRIARAFVEQSITERLCWVPVPVDAETTIASVFPGYGETTHQKRTRDLNLHLFDEVESFVHEIVSGIMRCDRTWHMWTTRRIGNDVWLEPGIDFRIHEWENAVREQRLDYPTHVAEAMDEEIHEHLLQDEITSRTPLTEAELQQHLMTCRRVIDRQQYANVVRHMAYAGR